MRRFFRSVRFRVIAIISAIVILISIIVGCTGGFASPQTSVVGSAVTAVQGWISSGVNNVKEFFTVFDRVDQLESENAELRSQISSMTDEQLNYQQALTDNEFYKQYLEIKDEHQDFIFCPGTVVSRSSADTFGSFTIDSGSLDGVSRYDPVITESGLVGYISAVGPTYSTVMTVLDPSLKAGALDRRTADSGILQGSVSLSAEGLTRINKIARNSSVAVGDYFVTSGGGGIFPAGLLIGTVTELAQDEGELTIHAILQPAVDTTSVTQVMVITSFDGQTSLGEITK